LGPKNSVPHRKSWELRKKILFYKDLRILFLIKIQLLDNENPKEPKINCSYSIKAKKKKVKGLPNCVSPVHSEVLLLCRHKICYRCLYSNLLVFKKLGIPLPVFTKYSISFFLIRIHRAVLRIRDVLSRIRIPDLGGEKAPDPGSWIPDPTVHKNRDEK
jgi:hypothetical protein